MIHVYTVTTLINNLISLSFGSQLRNGCKYKIQYYLKKEEAPIEYPAIRVTSFVSIVVYLTFLDEFFLTSVQVWEKKIRFKKSDKIIDTATLNFVTSTARVIFNKGNFCFSYDLKSSYHHIEIFDTDRTYLGSRGTYKVRNEIETKRNETKSTKTKRNETKRNEINEMKTK